MSLHFYNTLTKIHSQQRKISLYVAKSKVHQKVTICSGLESNPGLRVAGENSTTEPPVLNWMDNKLMEYRFLLAIYLSGMQLPWNEA